LNKNKCSTGIDELDALLEGGFFRGTIILLAGHPGVGKTTFGAQFIWNGLEKFSESGVYISFSEPKFEFYRHMKALGFDFEKYEKQRKFTFIDALPTISLEEFEKLLARLFEIAYETDAKRVVMDSITALTGTVDPSKARILLQNTIIKPFKSLGIVLLLIADLPHGQEAIGYGFEEFLADAVLKMILDESRGLVRRVLMIHKVREHPVPRIGYEFVIESGGIRLFTPLELGLKGSFTRERLSSGIPSLDDMLGGGIFKGSITLISGPSGTGKTMLSMSFALAGALHGEKVVYISFEEPSEQLQLLIKNLGYNFESIKDYLEILSLSPRLFTPGTIYNLVEKILKEKSPQRLVIDGLTALERQYPKREYLELVRSIAILCKIRGVTTYFTSLKNIIKDEIAEISTMTDNIIALWFDYEREKIERKITILKSRGSKHDLGKRNLSFAEGKILIT